MVIKVRYIFFILLSFLATIFLSGCQITLLNPQGLVAADEKNILMIAVSLMLLIVIPVIVLTFLFAWQYRAGNQKAVYQPEWSHHHWLEFFCWLIPCLIIVALAIITWNSTFRLDPYKSLVSKTKPLVIQAIALEWKWLFIYPEQQVAVTNLIKFPVDTPIEFLITAEGPMNSFQIPQLAGQIYAMDGMQTKLHLIANHIGQYPGISANFSGEGFSEMKFHAEVTSKTEFEQWIQSIKQSANDLTPSVYHELLKPNVNNTVMYFAHADQNIFSNAIMKSMMPMNKMPEMHHLMKKEKHTTKVK